MDWKNVKSCSIKIKKKKQGDIGNLEKHYNKKKEGDRQRQTHALTKRTRRLF